MKYNMTTPCDACPFLKSSGFSFRRLREHASGDFPCHKACEVNEETGNYEPKSDKTPHCAGALIFLEKRKEPHLMMRIAEYLGMYDRTKLNMKAPVGAKEADFKRTRVRPAAKEIGAAKSA